VLSVRLMSKLQVCTLLQALGQFLVVPIGSNFYTRASLTHSKHTGTKRCLHLIFDPETCQSTKINKSLLSAATGASAGSLGTTNSASGNQNLQSNNVAGKVLPPPPPPQQNQARQFYSLFWSNL
jgi:hypothetical protein